MVLGYIGLLAGRILQAAVSRQRERLADASAVQFTRNPEGLKDALLKIAGLGEGSRLTAADAEQVAHMLFAPGLRRLFATHPPLAERIRALDPELRRASTLPRLAAEAHARRHRASMSRCMPMQPCLSWHPAWRRWSPRDPERIAAQVGQLDTLHIAHAHAAASRAAAGPA